MDHLHQIYKETSINASHEALEAAGLHLDGIHGAGFSKQNPGVVIQLATLQAIYGVMVALVHSPRGF